MKKDFESRFMPNVKFKAPFIFIAFSNILDINETWAYYKSNADGDNLLSYNNEESFNACQLNEVHYFDAIPELLPDGMRYNKELDKLVPDVIEEQYFKNQLKDGTYPHSKFFTSYLPSINDKTEPIKQNYDLDKNSEANEYIAGIDSSNDLQDILESDMKYGDKLRAIRNTDIEVKEQITPHYYGETCLCGRKIDWYVIGDLYRKDKGSAWDHAGKKLLRAGEGHKTLKEDIKEVINSLSRWLEQIEDKEKTNAK